MMVRRSGIWKLYPVYSIVLFGIISPEGIGRVKVQEVGGGLWMGSLGRASSDEPGWP
jgi:hypothetical protein